MYERRTQHTRNCLSVLDDHKKIGLQSYLLKKKLCLKTEKKQKIARIVSIRIFALFYRVVLWHI